MRGSTHATPMLSALTAALLLMMAAAPANAGTADEPEIEDPAGDVNPAGVMFQFDDPEVTAAFAQRAEMYDIVKAFITGENNDYFHVQIHVVDIEDDWVIPVAAPVGQSTATVDVNGTTFQWDESFMNDRINLTANFTIRGQAYRAIVTLAEVDLANPNAPVRANSHASVTALLAQARLELDAAQAHVQDLPLSALSVRNQVNDAINQAHGYIDGAQQRIGDAYTPTGDPGADNAQSEAHEAIRQHIDDAQDSVRTAQQTLQGLDLGPVDPLDPKAQALAALTDAQAGIDSAEAVFLAMPGVAAQGPGDPGADPDADPAEPRVVLFHRFAIAAPDGTETPIGGTVDAEGDYVRAAVPKNLVGSPGRGDTLTQFYVASSVRGHNMDFAPDATTFDPASDDVLDALFDAAEGTFVTPNYGRDYAFQYPLAPPSTAAPLSMEATGATTKTVGPGETAQYVFTLENAGTGHLSGMLSLNSAADGWTHELNADRFELSAGETASYVLHVVGFEGGTSTHQTRVSAHLEGASTTSLDFTTALKAPEDPDIPDMDEPDDGSKDTGNNTPGLGLVALLAGAGAALAVARRRRD